MEVVGLVASIGTLVEITVTVTSLAAKYGAAIKNAREDTDRIGSEVADISILLLKVKDMVHGLNERGFLSEKWPVLQSASLKGGQIDRIKSALDTLVEQLTPANGLKKLEKFKEAALWPQKLGNINKALEAVKKEKEFFDKALSIDTTGQVFETGRVVLQVATAQADARTEKVCRWLSTVDPSKNHVKARQRHESRTGRWFVDSAEFHSWRITPKSFLWLHGLAGSGKTILSSTTIAKLESECNEDRTRALAYFYFDFNDHEKQQVANFVRSITAQFCAKRERLPDEIQSLYDQSKGMHQPDIMKLVKLLPSLVEGFASTYIVVDALDECSEWTFLLERITAIISLGIKRLHILAASREEHKIKAWMERSSATRVSVRGPEIDNDIRLYVRSRIKEDSTAAWDESDKDTIEKTLVEGAHGMFRWVYCQIEALRECHTPDDLDQALKDLPQTLDETYERILKRIPRNYASRARAAFQWLAVSERPMCIDEVAEAAIQQPDQCSLDPRKMFRTPGALLDICGSLLTTVDTYEGKEIRFAHYSVKEYLVSTRIRDGACSEFAIRESEAHRFVVDTCLSYLLLLDQPNHLSQQTLDEHPLLRYVAEHWPTHFIQGRPEQGHHHAPDSPTMKRAEALFDNDKTVCFTNWLRIWNPDWNPIMQRLDPQLDGELGAFASSLYYASLLSLFETVELSIKNGADLNLQGGRYGPALQAASYEGHEAVVQLLLDHSADPNLQGGEYGSALQAASWRGSEAVVQLLLDHSADPNLQGGEYGSALQAASWRGSEAVMQLLLDHSADPNLQGGKHGSALQAASWGGSEAVVQLLLDHSADPNLQGGEFGSALQAASYDGGEAVVQLLLDHSADPNLQGGEFGSALQAASYDGEEAVVQLLLDHSADPNLQGGRYGTALQAASCRDRQAVMQLLLDHSADPNLQGGRYGSALQAASWRGSEAVVQLLLDHSADPNLQGGEYGSALQAASYDGEEAVMQLLLDHSADPNLQGGKHGSALQAASYWGRQDAVQLLLDRGADPNLQGGRYGSALRVAQAKGYSDIADLLRSQGAVETP